MVSVVPRMNKVTRTCTLGPVNSLGWVTVCGRVYHLRIRGVVGPGRGGGAASPHFFSTGGRVSHSPHFFGLKFVQKFSPLSQLVTY